MQKAKIKYRDLKTTQYGEKIKLKTHDDIEIWVPASHKDQASLNPGAEIMIEQNDNGKWVYKGLFQTSNTSEEPSSLGESGLKGVYSSTPTTSADFATICATWAAAYEYVHHFLPAAGNEEKLAATSTIFIQAAREKAWVKSDGDE